MNRMIRNPRLMATHALLPLAAMLLAGCGGVLPSKQTVTPSMWDSFDMAKASYDQVVPGETHLDDLQAMGYDPEFTPNVRRLNYLELIEVFMPHVSIQREIGRAHV